MAKRDGDGATARAKADMATLLAILDGRRSKVNDALKVRADAVRAGDKVVAATSADLMCWAAGAGDTEAIRRLLEIGVKAAAKLELALPPYTYDDARRWTNANSFAREGEPRMLTIRPILAAVCRGQVDACRELLDAGADANDDFDGPMITHAVGREHDAVVALLIERGANLDVKTARGSLLGVAVGRDNVKTVELLLRAGCDPNARNDRGGVPLTGAAWGGKAKMVRALIAAGAEVNPTPPTADMIKRPPLPAFFNKTEKQKIEYSMPLIRAAQEGHTEVVRILLDSGADPNAKDSDGQTAYDAARKGNHAEVVQLLRDAGGAKAAKAKPVDLFMAAESGRVDEIKAALDSGINVNQIGGASSMDAFLAKTVSKPGGAQNLMANLMGLLKGEDGDGLGEAMDDRAKAYQDVPIEHIDVSALMLASKNGHVDAVKYLLSRGADVKVTSTSDFTPGHTALHFAARKGHVEVMRALLDAGADAKSPAVHLLGHLMNTPLHEAAGNGHAEAVRLLLERGADPSIRVHDQTPLDMASCGGNQEVIELLMKAGAKVTDGSGSRTALHNAAANGEVETVRKLLAAGIDPNSMCEAGTPIHAAASGDATRLMGKNKKLDHPVAVMRVLVEAGGDVRIARADGETPLYAAAVFADAVEFLLAHGADVNAKCNDGTNALWMATLRNSPESVQLLLAAGADPNAVEAESGSSTLDVAIENKRGKCRKLLESAGAKRAKEL